MGRRIISILVIAAATVGVIWYFKRPGSEAPAPKAVAAPALATTIPAVSKAASQPIEAPKAQPAPKPVESPNPGASSNSAVAKGDPQVELSSAIDDIAMIIQGGNIMALFEKYATPEEQAKMSPEEKAQMEQASAQMMSQPEGQQMIQVMVTALQSLKDQSPEMNAAGDEATYQMTMTPPDGNNANPRTRAMTFINIDGKWYIKMAFKSGGLERAQIQPFHVKTENTP